MHRTVIAGLLLPGGLACGNDPTSNTGGVRERWYQPQPGYAWARPAVLGDLVYFGTGDGQVIARDRATGAVRWTARVGTEAINGAALLVRSGVLVVPVVRHTVGLDAATGRARWRYEAPLDTTGKGGGPAYPGQVVLSHLDADDQTVYIPSWGASIAAVDLRTGAVRWIWSRARSASDTSASGVFPSGAAGVRLSGDTVFATGWHFRSRLGVPSEAMLVALDRNSGRELWQMTRFEGRSGTLVWGAPSVHGQLVLFKDNFGHVYAVDRATQAVVWEQPPRGRLSASSQLEVAGDTVYLDGGDEYLYALRAGSGTELWRASFPTQATTDLLLTTNRIFLTTGRYLHVFDRTTGRKLLSTQQPRTDDGVFSSPAIAAGSQIFVTVNGAAWSFYEP